MDLEIIKSSTYNSIVPRILTNVELTSVADRLSLKMDSFDLDSVVVDSEGLALFEVGEVVPSVEFNCWGVADTFVAVGSCGDSCVETGVAVVLPDGWGSLSVGITLVDEVSPVSLFLGLEEGKGYSEVTIVFSKIKCVCVVHDQITGTVNCHVLHSFRRFHGFFYFWRGLIYFWSWTTWTTSLTTVWSFLSGTTCDLTAIAALGFWSFTAWTICDLTCYMRCWF